MSVRDRLAEVAATAGLAVAFLVAIVLQAVAIAQTWGARYWLAGGAAAVAVCGLALLRHRQRTWTAVAGFTIAGLAVVVARVFHLPTEPGPAMALALAVLVGSAVRVLPPASAVVLAAAGLAVVGAACLAVRAQPSGPSAVLGMNLMAWLGAVTVGLALRWQDDRAAAAAEKVRRDERLELARELHDVVAHHITGMLVQAQAARLVARRNPGQAVESLAGIEAAGTEALRAMRRVVGLLRDTEDAPPASAGPEQLSVLVERFNRQGPSVRLLAPDESVTWPPEVTSTVYRIVREALTNVARHARDAHGVIVSVDQTPSAVTVEVTDDAPSATPRPAHRGGYGLVGMRERVETLGGTLLAGPRPGRGWSVLATLPIHDGQPR
ncbi:Signal transduction histidine kinase [Micromonospora citrea]|uniref:histidine kinase n=1 Tax=Micromonospora citrea TaxID=47855 RepID=A0A1C6VXG7_9ACTN|nr:histidine kinase [Micromonospora citrea]SCL70907.1 Signal transduction histidine kinase [Micromonospora citrea]